MRRALVWCWLVGAVLGCESTATEVRVFVSASPALLTEPGVLSVQAFDDSGALVYEAERFVGGRDGIALPTPLRVVARSGGTHVRVDLGLTTAGTPAVRRTLVLPFRPGEILERNVTLEAGCQGVTCEAGRACACPEPGCATGLCLPFGPCEGEALSCGGSRLDCADGYWSHECR